MDRSTFFIRAAAIFGSLAVALGAFGAHGLETVLKPEMLETYEVGARYQFYHTLALLAIGLIGSRRSNRVLNGAGFSFLAGIILFSGSLYLLATREVTGFGGSWLGAITPIGGICFILGWIFLFLFTFSETSTND